MTDRLIINKNVNSKNNFRQMHTWNFKCFKNKLEIFKNLYGNCPEAV